MTEIDKITVDAMIHKYNELCNEWSGHESRIHDAMTIIEEIQPRITKLQDEAHAVAQWLDKNDKRCFKPEWEEQFFQRVSWNKRETCAACGRVHPWYRMRWAHEEYLKDKSLKGKRVCIDVISCSGQDMGPLFPPKKED